MKINDFYVTIFNPAVHRIFLVFKSRPFLTLNEDKGQQEKCQYTVVYFVIPILDRKISPNISPRRRGAG